jgi:hypothetical protein
VRGDVILGRRKARGEQQGAGASTRSPLSRPDSKKRPRKPWRRSASHVDGPEPTDWPTSTILSSATPQLDRYVCAAEMSA